MSNVAPLQPNNPDANAVEHVWNADTLTAVSSFAATVSEIAKKRQALNDEKAAAQSALVAIGFNKDALKAAISYAGTPEDERDSWDRTYIYARRALGCPIQEDLFVAAMGDSVTVSVPADKETDD